MKDEKGLFYYPILENKNIKMYVRLGKEDVEFRMWDKDDPKLWDDHNWVPWPAITQAAELYKKEGRGKKPPLHLYDIDIAIRLIRDDIEDKRG